MVWYFIVKYGMGVLRMVRMTMITLLKEGSREGMSEYCRQLS